MRITIPRNREQLKAHLRDPLFRNSYFLMANRITGAGAGFVFWLIAARCYSPHEVGLANAIISAMNLLVLFSALGFGFGIISYLPGENDKKGMVNSCFTITGICSALLALVFVSGIPVWSPALMIIRENMVLLICFILFTIAVSIFILQSSVFVAFREAKYTFIQNFVAVARVAILPFLIALSVSGIYLAYGLGAVIALIAGNLLIRRVFPEYMPVPAIKKRVINRMIRFSFGSKTCLWMRRLARDKNLSSTYHLPDFQ